MRPLISPYLLAALAVSLVSATALAQSESAPPRLLVDSVADLALPSPRVQTGTPAAGKRVFLRPAGDTTGPAAVLALPSNWSAEEVWPVFVELPGNGGYRDSRGDSCTGLPEDCSLGFGLTAGRDWIWLSLPFLSADGSRTAITWWGDAPEYNPSATLEFWQQILQSVLRNYSGDSHCVVLAGFSRGAIACNALGLHDDRTSQLWTAFLPYSHYDGVRRWPYPDSTPAAAAARLQRLQQRPQFICAEGTQTEITRKWLAGHLEPAAPQFQFHATGFVNHSDHWVLHDVPARRAARAWLQQLRKQRPTLK